MEINIICITVDAWQLIGCKQSMQFANDSTAELWRNFKLINSNIEDRISSDWVNLTQYTLGTFEAFNPNTEFIRWAGVVVSKNTEPPANFEKLEVPGGLYAQFTYTGTAQDYPETFLWFLQSYCPQNNLKIDESRPHYEIIKHNEKPGLIKEELIHIPIIAL